MTDRFLERFTWLTLMGTVCLLGAGGLACLQGALLDLLEGHLLPASGKVLLAGLLEMGAYFVWRYRGDLVDRTSHAH